MLSTHSKQTVDYENQLIREVCNRVGNNDVGIAIYLKKRKELTLEDDDD